MSFCRLVTADVESDMAIPHGVVDEVADGSESGRDGKFLKSLKIYLIHRE